jgi:hypothetical protein
MLCNNAALLSLVTVTAVFGRKFALMVLPEMSGLAQSDPTKAASHGDGDTQQPTFLMNFRGGNDSPSVALAGPIPHLRLGPF